ncbi:hypothetical protein [Saccharopolyspora hattusasensis]|uniref:hypothetical protein n=1 Tax=Saccharopolyspora hattusasensis TaxID=1128679 RepID=UPI003D96704F
MKKTGPKRFLPMAWHVEQVSPTEVYTFRWGRGSGVFTVHRGDIGSSHDDNHLIATVRIGRDWIDEWDIATQARQWRRSRAGPRRRGT